MRDRGGQGHPVPARRLRSVALAALPIRRAGEGGVLRRAALFASRYRVPDASIAYRDGAGSVRPSAVPGDKAGTGRRASIQAPSRQWTDEPDGKAARMNAPPRPRPVEEAAPIGHERPSPATEDGRDETTVALLSAEPRAGGGDPEPTPPRPRGDGTAPAGARHQRDRSAIGRHRLRPTPRGRRPAR
ncbi:hypothetical protein GCM10027294_47980 [Marinactinospora endophytica]